ncbi:GrpB family protein [Candidatus Saccharibacteria bacterium]|nr:GrpB family protein [Candidatus Saccharibacteria bacterium]
MSVKINAYNDNLRGRFEVEAKRIREVLGGDVSIEHVGSSAVGIGGKNIVDILVGVRDTSEMERVRDLLVGLGYREGHDSHPERIFMAWRKDDDGTDRETGEGDYHVHISVEGSEEYLNFIRLRDYLRAHRDEALEYERMKSVFAEKARYDRKKYKALKSEYVKELIGRAQE